MKKNIGLNMILNATRQFVTLALPLITYPYALRILGVDSIGRINYSSSIVSYFMLIATLGINAYAIREGAKLRDDEEKINCFASQIFTINIISTFVSYGLIAVFLITNKSFNDYERLFLLQSISIVLNTIGVDWINGIFEDYLFITIRSISISTVTVIALFSLVKTPFDYYKYSFIQVGANFLICTSNWIYCKRYVRIRPSFHIEKKHIKPIIILFANTIAISIYVNSDVTMLGWWEGDEAVGYYSAAVKVYLMVKSLLMAVYSVVIPRLSYLYEQNDLEEFKKIFTNLWGELSVILIPIGVGLNALSPFIMRIFGGEQYIPSSSALKVLSFALIFAIYAGLVSPVLNVSISREKDNLYATLISALANFVLNFYFIKRYSFLGAAITTLVSEAIAFVFPLVRVQNISSYLHVCEIRKSCLKVIISSLSIILVYYISTKIFDGCFNVIFCTIVFGSFAYFACLRLFNDLFFKKIVLDVTKKNYLISNNKILNR